MVSKKYLLIIKTQLKNLDNFSYMYKFFVFVLCQILSKSIEKSIDFLKNNIYYSNSILFMTRRSGAKIFLEELAMELAPHVEIFFVNFFTKLCLTKNSCHP